MQESQNQENVQQQENSGSVSFPSVSEPKKSGGAKTVLIVGILVLVAILGFVIYKSASNKSTSDESATPSTFDNLTTPSSEQTVPTFTAAPSATPTDVKADTSKTDKSKVQIQVQNGTGITGEAAYLQTQLSGLGYTNVKVGNSDSNVTSTTVSFSSTLDSSVVTEITQKLNAIYQTVSTKTSSTSTFDIVVVTGLRKGATSKPSSTTGPTGTPSSKSSPTPSPKVSATPSVKPTATP